MYNYQKTENKAFVAQAISTGFYQFRQFLQSNVPAPVQRGASWFVSVLAAPFIHTADADVRSAGFTNPMKRKRKREEPIEPDPEAALKIQKKEASIDMKRSKLLEDDLAKKVAVSLKVDLNLAEESALDNLSEIVSVASEILFFPSKFAGYFQDENVVVSRKILGLARSVEFHSDKTCAILLNRTSRGDKLLGITKNKKVTRALDLNTLQVYGRPVLRLPPSNKRNPLEADIKYTKKLQGKPGLVETFYITYFKNGTGSERVSYIQPEYSDHLGRAAIGIINNRPKKTLEEKFYYSIGILTGLEQMHNEGICHMDVKPPNILEKEGKAVLADFDLAMPLGDLALARRGTSGYRAPELCHKSQPCTFAMDVYSTGVTLSELFFNSAVQLDPFIKSMQDPDPLKRPSASHALEFFKSELEALQNSLPKAQMKEKLEVSETEWLADFLPTSTIKTNDFDAENIFDITKEAVQGEPQITEEHIKNNQSMSGGLAHQKFSANNPAVLKVNFDKCNASRIP